MKATYENGHITLLNGVRFLQSEGESNDDFKARVAEVVERDYCEDLEIEDKSSEKSPIKAAISKGPVPVEPEMKKGQVISFAKRLTGKVVQGQIIYIMTDKRKNLTYYRVKESSGKIHIVRTNNKSIK